MGGSLLLLKPQTLCFSLCICLYYRESVCFNYRKTFSFIYLLGEKWGVACCLELVVLKSVLFLWQKVGKVQNYELGIPRFKSWVHIIFCEAKQGKLKLLLSSQRNKTNKPTENHCTLSLPPFALCHAHLTKWDSDVLPAWMEECLIVCHTSSTSSQTMLNPLDC